MQTSPYVNFVHFFSHHPLSKHAEKSSTKNSLDLEDQICRSVRSLFILTVSNIFLFYVDALYLIFNGSYRVQHVLSNKSPRREKYAFRIKTSQKNALLFYARGPKNYKDFMQIEIDYSRIKLKVNFGEDGMYGRVFNFL